MRHKLRRAVKSSAFSCSNRLPEVLGVPVDDDGGQQVQPGHAVVLTFGAGVAGMLVGSFYAMGVVFARQIGMSVTEAALFMSVVVLGGLGFQMPVGIMADKFDRRIVMSCMLIGVGASWGFDCEWGAIGGLDGHGIGVWRRDQQRLSAMRCANFRSAGPEILCRGIRASVDGLFHRSDNRPAARIGAHGVYGPSSFFMFESAVAIAYAVFVLISVRAGPGLPADGREKFVPLPDISPVAMGLDPRTEPERSTPNGQTNDTAG